ncbi:hypothetical protein [Bradyrhizobium genosp. L]|uniref:hypothetical protein n=1 Tax=Bradyrhizobium genosp. L TaxID=83637 RepID=UPI001AEE42BA|nr:hypothetical protein [Bradyrhizobium genosp. L]
MPEAVMLQFKSRRRAAFDRRAAGFNRQVAAALAVFSTDDLRQLLAEIEQALEARGACE